MLENGIAVPSCSSWASPCLLVRKADSTYRFCTDYRKLNAITKPDAFSTSLEWRIVWIRWVQLNFVSKLDLLKGYWQVPLSPRAREVTSFITPSGLYSYSVMSFWFTKCTCHLPEIDKPSGIWAGRVCSVFG